MKALVILSGGQDSATALAMAIAKHGAENVAALTFTYGQRHSIEVKYAKRLAKLFKVAEHRTVKMNFMSELASSALLSKEAKIERRKGACCPTSVVEGRNAFFLTAGAVRAKELGAREVWIGVSEADSSGYPDCRAKFVHLQQAALRAALDWPVEIKAPFLRKTKAQEWAIADKLGVLEIVRDKTISCYNGIEGEGCGKCPACILRKRGYEEYLKGKRK